MTDGFYRLLDVARDSLSHTLLYRPAMTIARRAIEAGYFSGYLRYRRMRMSSFQRSDNPHTGAVFVIDFPYAEIGHPIEFFPGWFYVTDERAEVSILANERAVDHIEIDRPDLRNTGARGFSLYFDLSRVIDTVDVRDPKVVFSLCVDGRVETEMVFGVPGYVVEPALSAVADRKKRLAKIRPLLCCSACRSKRLSFEDGKIVCGDCASSFRQSPVEGGAPDGYCFLEDDMEVNTRLVNKTDPVSAHVYAHDLLERINRIDRDNALILDVGAGLRRQVFPHLVCVELFDYPSTDVRSTGSRLPFDDDCFDMVISNAVLEHVPNPFADASELVRVLKPGGELYVAVPLLQPEHGYPYHYFNMTRSGLRELFNEDKGLEIVSHGIQRGGEPIFSLLWFLGLYSGQLPEAEREALLGMSVGDLLARPPDQWLESGIVKNLRPEGQWALACSHTLIARKLSPGPQR